LRGDSLPGETELALLPAAFQEPIFPKRDVRVTVVGEWLAAAIAEPVPGKQLDWRLEPDRGWSPYELPEIEAERCVSLVAALGLRFGGIDLVVDQTGQHWFLEINPNGEWGWLAQGSGLPIVEALADDLSQRRAARV
jgi:glutathione synthase/RimK-type ligase-like ATP-grasp enzyme